MNAVLCTEVTRHVEAQCPDKPNVMERLQNSRYFKVVQLPGIPDQFLLDLHAIVMPHQLPQVTDILARIKPMHPKSQGPPQIANIFTDQPKEVHYSASSREWVSVAYVKATQCQVESASQLDFC